MNVTFRVGDEEQENGSSPRLRNRTRRLKDTGRWAGAPRYTTPYIEGLKPCVILWWNFNVRTGNLRREFLHEGSVAISFSAVIAAKTMAAFHFLLDLAV